ncbi:MAG TPA: hypothetical protein VLG44_00665 [Chlamydiales bacterium]|nr:hypothetical protein [Chlamydiales bacterium]
MAVFLGPKSSFGGVHDSPYSTIKGAEFCRVDFKAFEDRDVVVFDSLTKDSLLSNVCVDFSLKELSASCKDKRWASFHEFFFSLGFKGDHLKYGYYSTTNKEEIQKLASILLATNTFPKSWLPFFEALAKEGKWIIETKP